MANVFTKHLPTRVAEKNHTMEKLTSKLQRTATNIGFINKVIHNKVIPNFTEVKGHLLNNNDKHDSEMPLKLGSNVSLNAALNAVNKFETQISGKGAVTAGKGLTLFSLNEDLNDIIRIVKL